MCVEVYKISMDTELLKQESVIFPIPVSASVSVSLNMKILKGAIKTE